MLQCSNFCQSESVPMRRLGSTVARLTALRRNAMASMPLTDAGRLTPLTGFGANPGALDALVHIPDALPSGAPLVVILHGCTQNAAAYDTGSGWSALADRHGFALLYPQQRRGNNANLCFNWFDPADARRGHGELHSIAEMIAHLVKERDLDPARVFVTGLSAGGAMTAAMMACYPELFAGGAIIAGLPFATADTLGEALERMRGVGGPSRRELATLAGKAAPSVACVPTLSVWHGTSDRIVDPANAGAIVDQWRDLYGLGETSGTIDRLDGHRRETWRDRDGRALVTRHDIAGMGHGVPVSAKGCGKVGPHMLEAGTCSSSRIAESWGLTATLAAQSTRTERTTSPTPAAAGVGAVIEDALRAAGLMR